MASISISAVVVEKGSLLPSVSSTGLSSSTSRASILTELANRSGIRQSSHKACAISAVGAVRNGAVRNGAVRNGAVRNGAVRNAPTTSQPPSQSTTFEKSATAPAWSVLTDEISVGPLPRSPQNLKLLVKSTNINAFVFLETEEGCKNMGLDWENFKQTVNEEGIVAVRLSMRYDDQKDQAAALPEAIRAVAALANLGYKVHISCNNGIHRSPLVALGYLTLMKSMTITEAWQLLVSKSPLARPNIETLRQVVGRDFAKSQFERSVSTDVSLSEAVANATSAKVLKDAQKQPSAIKPPLESSSESGSYAKDRLDFFARQLENLKAKEEEARKAALAATKEKEVLKRQVEALAHGSSASAVSFPASASPASASRSLTLEEVQDKIRVVKDQKAAAEKELKMAKTKLQTLVEKVSSLQSSLVEASSGKRDAQDRAQSASSALRNLSRTRLDREALEEKKAELTKKEAEAKQSIVFSQDRIEFLNGQIAVFQSKEGEVKAAVDKAAAKVKSLEAEIAALKAKESTAPKAASLPKAANASAVTSADTVAALQEKLNFFTNRFEVLSKREDKSRAALNERISKYTNQITELKLKLAAADVLANANSKRIEEMAQEINEYQKKETRAAETIKSQGDRIDFFNRHVENLRKKEAEAREAATSASDLAKSLRRTVGELERREAMALQQIQGLNSKVATLVQFNAEMGVQLEETQSREKALEQVLEDGTGLLSRALESEKTIKELRAEAQKAAKALVDERIRADLLAAELERELMATGKKPKHYNDVEKVPAGEIEKALMSQMASTQQSITAAGGGTAVASVDTTTTGGGQLTLLRNVLLGALGMAAIPVSLMAAFQDIMPSNMIVDPPPRNEIPAAQPLPPKPIVQPASAESFCEQTTGVTRSARVEKFCSALAEIALE